MSSFSNSPSESLKLLKPTDRLAVPLATGQPLAFMNALSERNDWERLEIFTGLLMFPFPILQHPKVFVTSGYYGPIERFLNQSGANMDYLPANFTGFEVYARRNPPRVIAATVSEPDADGFVTFGTHNGAISKPFTEACRDQNRIAIAEINPNMPIIYGSPEYGDNKIHIDEISHKFISDQSAIEMPVAEPTEAEQKIADHVMSLIESGVTLQFGIGPVPDLIAEKLSKSPMHDFGIHTELLGDGFLKMYEAGKISNRNKKLFPNQSAFTFAYGSQSLYKFLDERNRRNNRQAIALPVSVVNDPHLIARNENFTSINSALMIDLAGQVCSEAIGRRQYSGVGGQLSFVEGAYLAENGRSILCLKSTAKVGDQQVSNIVVSLPSGSLVSTPRHFVQYVVTEFGIADLYGVSDENRPEKLIDIAHPDFREQLREEFAKIKC